MKYSKLFVSTLKNAPKDADTVNHRLLTQAGFVDQLMAGVYSYLPLGLRVLNKIEQIVREEMNAIDGQEVLMPILHPKAIWQTTGGWDSIDVLFKINSRTEKEYALGQSEEEVVTPLVMKHVNSYHDLPQAVYQIHWKFRDELRAKSGILRGREFLMKDMYSFHENQEDFDRFYEVVKKAYLKIYKRLGLIAKVTEASGGNFTKKISYEFMVLTDAGEDDILYCDACDFCANVEITEAKEGDSCPKCKKSELKKARASEAGNVFDLGQKYSKDFDLSFVGRDGKPQYAVMGCYGIGISRAMGILVEKHHDDRGIIWPESVAPFQVHLISLKENEKADNVYKELVDAGIEVLYDDREDIAAGAKFADADLIGIPVRLVVSAKSGDKIEFKKRTEKDAELITLEEILKRFKK
ncbi:MAG TPA: aminoacyl--tRNA ligase-related protein [Candidatus Saccharimonadales bacterium]|nr:aminoacyl--tRNA ligase-related protein [Candidatus Saccharimonadales bacterium]